MNEVIWIPIGKAQKGNFYPCHEVNISFDVACTVFRAKGVRFKATKGAPKSGRHFMLGLTTSRRAIVTCYDDSLLYLEISLELEEQSDGDSVAYYEDLRQIIEPLELSMPDKSMMGCPTWR